MFVMMKEPSTAAVHVDGLKKLEHHPWWVTVFLSPFSLPAKVF